MSFPNRNNTNEYQYIVWRRHFLVFTVIELLICHIQESYWFSKLYVYNKTWRKLSPPYFDYLVGGESGTVMLHNIIKQAKTGLFGYWISGMTLIRLILRQEESVLEQARRISLGSHLPPSSNLPSHFSRRNITLNPCIIHFLSEHGWGTGRRSSQQRF